MQRTLDFDEEIERQDMDLYSDTSSVAGSISSRTKSTKSSRSTNSKRSKQSV